MRWTLIGFAGASVALTCCGINRPPASKDLYVLPATNLEAVESSGTQVLRMGMARVAAPFGSRAFQYRVDEARFEPAYYSQWSDDPGSLITSAMAEALQSFNRRAELVADELGRSGYRIVRININTGGGRVAPVAFRSRAMTAEADVAQPALEAGTQTVSVNVSGTIELNAPR